MGGVGLAVALALSGCAPEQTGPSSSGGTLGTITPPAIGGQTSASALIGDWTVETIILISADLQTTTVAWRFAADGSCRQSVTTLLVSEGIPRTTARDCTYAENPGTVTVSVPGTLPATFSVAFAAFSRDRLVLDGLEYRRVG